MKKNKTKRYLLILLVLTLLISIGYAILSTDVEFIGSSRVKSATWDVHLENLRATDGSVAVVNQPRISANKRSITYDVDLYKPGDYYELLVDVKNAGTIDATVNEITSTMKINDGEFINVLPTNIPRYLAYTITNSDGSAIYPKQVINAGEVKTYKIRLEYKTNINASDLPTTEQNLQFNFGINYIQNNVNV